MSLGRVLREILRATGYGALGAAVLAALLVAHRLSDRPDLSVWHRASLDEEFTRHSDVDSFTGYLELEARLFEQLEHEVYDRVDAGPNQAVLRYSRGSLADPGRWPVDWNRTFEWARDAPRAGVLLLHGLSDSPYSLRTIGQAMHDRGAWVVGLRLPGHGTAPSGLTGVRWEDMAAAVRLAMVHLRESVADAPIYVVGYSNGGALGVQYALRTVRDDTLPRPAGLVLISPAIGVTGLARLAVWQARVGRLLGLDQLMWTSVVPEYDPFKFGSFAINAGELSHRLTVSIQSQVRALEPTGLLRELPEILAFQSAVDATVSTRALIEHLFARLPRAGHELVLFDINRVAGMDPLLARDPRAELAELIRGLQRRFDLTVVSNRNDRTRDVVTRSFPAGSDAVTETPSGLDWPRGIYSLSHVALPFPRNDPLYGGDDSVESPGIRLGNLDLRGERGVLRITGTATSRLRWNPFYEILESRVLDFTGLSR